MPEIPDEQSMESTSFNSTAGKKKKVRPTGFEPVTFGSGGQRSIQLSYGRIIRKCFYETPREIFQVLKIGLKSGNSNVCLMRPRVPQLRPASHTARFIQCIALNRLIIHIPYSVTSGSSRFRSDGRPEFEVQPASLPHYNIGQSHDIA
jgi:hypothetical protein